MKHILVPTNFTHASENALAYAVGIATAYHRRVIMCCVITSSVPVGANATLHKKDLEEKHQNAYMQMRVALSQFADYKYKDTNEPVQIEPLILEGHPEDAMSELIKDEGVSMVVLSHKDSSEVKDLFLSSTMVKNANCPILTVPEYIEYKPLSHIVYAANFDENDAQRIKDLLDLTGYFDAKLDCLHVCTDGKKLREENEKMQALQAQFDVMAYSKLSFKVIRDQKSVSTGLETYLSKNTPDMLVMLRQEKSFFKRLFKRSNIRQMTLDNGTPFMIYRQSN